MALTIRELRVEEWDRLASHPALGGFGQPDPQFSRIVVAEDGDKIVGVWVLVQVVHTEPVWIDPAYQNRTIGGRMWKKIKEILDSCSVKQAFCFADRPDIANYLSRLGMLELPYRVFKYEVTKCPQQ